MTRYALRWVKGENVPLPICECRKPQPVPPGNWSCASCGRELLGFLEVPLSPATAEHLLKQREAKKV